MSQLKRVYLPQLPSLSISLESERTVAFTGTIATEHPSGELGAFFKALHTAAVEDQLEELVVNVKELTFVNSRAIRLFVDWVIAARKETAAHRYRIRFLTDPQVTWQKLSLPVLKTLAREIVIIEP